MSRIYDRGSALAITVAIIVLTLAAHTLIFNIDYPYTGQDYHPDEGVWTAVGKRYFQKFFIERDYSYETWNSYRFGDFGTGSPVVGKYIIGAALFLKGVVDIETVFPGYEFSDSGNWDDIKEQRPPENALEAARLPIQWMGIFSTLLVFLLTRELSNSWLIGLSAGMLFALHPLTLEYSQRAMMDIPLLFFSLMTLLLASLFLARIMGNRRLQLLAYAVGIGLSFGMAISIKVSAVVTLLIAASWGVIALIWIYRISFSPARNYLSRLFSAFLQDSDLLRITLSGALLSLLTVALVFISLNPFLYRNALRNTAHILGHGIRVAKFEVPIEQRLDSLDKRWNSLADTGLGKGGIFSNWLGLAGLDKILVGLGSAMCVYQIAKQDQPRNRKRGWIWLALWIVITWASVLLLLPFSWLRWYVPMAPIWAALEGMGIILVTQGGIVIFRQFSSWVNGSMLRA